MITRDTLNMILASMGADPRDPATIEALFERVTGVRAPSLSDLEAVILSIPEVDRVDAASGGGAIRFLVFVGAPEARARVERAAVALLKDRVPVNVACEVVVRTPDTEGAYLESVFRLGAVEREQP